MLDYDLNLSLLEFIVKKYEDLDIVPTGYHQPELYQAYKPESAKNESN